MKSFSQNLFNIYGEVEQSRARYQSLRERFVAQFQTAPTDFFTSPGRCEIIGNHTDHNGGKIIASSIDMDTIGAAARNESNRICIFSEGYPSVCLDLNLLQSTPKCDGTRSLLAGICQGFLKFGFRIGGFCAYLSSNVIHAAGVSSSASFEMLLCTIINYFFNDNMVSMEQCAQIGKYAENEYWDKKCGLLDEMACGIGGAVYLNFRNPNEPTAEKIEFDFNAMGYDLLLVNSGKGHADLSREYSEIPAEMNAVAQALGVSTLAETGLCTLLPRIPEIRSAVGDRAVLRALHFFQENARVARAREAMLQNDAKTLLALLDESGRSSWELLQNCYTISEPQEQSIPLVLSLTRYFLHQINDGCCRVHGGGFAGTVLCVLPKAQTEAYCTFLAQYVGKENIYPMKIRSYGAVHIDGLL